MAVVGQTVNNGDGSIFSQIFDFFLLVRTNHDAVEIAGKHAGCILYRFAASDLQVVGRQEQRLSAELMDAGFKGNAGSCGRFLENESDGFSFK